MSGLTNAEVIDSWIHGHSAYNKINSLSSRQGQHLYSYNQLIGEWVNGIPVMYNYTGTARYGPYGHLVLSIKFVSQPTSLHVGEAIKGGGMLIARYGKDKV